MVWTIVKRIEKSKYNESNLIYFDFFKTEKYCIFSNLSKKYLNIDKLKLGDYIYVVKSFTKSGVPIYLIKNVKQI